MSSLRDASCFATLHRPTTTPTRNDLSEQTPESVQNISHKEIVKIFLGVVGEAWRLLNNVRFLQDSESVCARRVILALPPSAILNVDLSAFPTNHHFRSSLTSLRSFPVLRIFFVYTDTWWKAASTQVNTSYDVITDLPLRHVRYVSASLDKMTERHVWMVAEAEDDATKYFRDLLHMRRYDSNSVTSCNDTAPLIDVVTRHLATLFDLDLEYVSRPSQVFVYEAGEWYVWRSGVDWNSVANFLQKPFENDDIFFTSGALCGGTCQLSAEGAIKVVDDVIDRYFETTVSYGVEQEREER